MYFCRAKYITKFNFNIDSVGEQFQYPSIKFVYPRNVKYLYMFVIKFVIARHSTQTVMIKKRSYHITMKSAFTLLYLWADPTRSIQTIHFLLL